MIRLLSILWENLCELAWACVIVAFAFVLVIMLGGCTTMTEKWLFENNNPPPTPTLAAPGETSRVERGGLSLDSEAVVLPELVSLTASWLPGSASDGWYSVYTGWDMVNVTNFFGRTKNWSITNTVIWPDGAERIYGCVYSENSFGVKSPPSYLAAVPDFPDDAVVIDRVPPTKEPVLVFTSPNGMHWVGAYVKLPTIASIDFSKPMALYRAETNSLSIHGLRLKNYSLGGR